MSYFIISNGMLTTCPYSDSNDRILRRNNSHRYVTKMGILYTLNNTGRAIYDWINNGPDAVVIPGYNIAEGVLIDSEYLIRPIIMTKPNGMFTVSSYPHDPTTFDNFVTCVDRDQQEKIQYALDEGYPVSEILKAMSHFSTDYRHAVTVPLSTVFLSMTDREKSFIRFVNPECYSEVNKDKVNVPK